MHAWLYTTYNVYSSIQLIIFYHNLSHTNNLLLLASSCRRWTFLLYGVDSQDGTRDRQLESRNQKSMRQTCSVLYLELEVCDHFRNSLIKSYFLQLQRHPGADQHVWRPLPNDSPMHELCTRAIYGHTSSGISTHPWQSVHCRGETRIASHPGRD